VQAARSEKSLNEPHSRRRDQSRGPVLRPVHVHLRRTTSASTERAL
jgi:hypothetical protein